MPNISILPLDSSEQKLVDEVVNLITSTQSMSYKSACLEQTIADIQMQSRHVDELLNNTSPKLQTELLSKLNNSKSYIIDSLKKAEFVEKIISKSVLPLSADVERKLTEISTLIFLAQELVNINERVYLTDILQNSIKLITLSVDKFLQNSNSNLTNDLLDDLEAHNNHLASDYNSAMFGIEAIKERIAHKVKVAKAVEETYNQVENLKLHQENTNPITTDQAVNGLIDISTDLQNAIKGILNQPYDFISPKQNIIAMYGINECAPTPHYEPAITQSSSSDLASINNLSNSPYVWGIGGFLLGAIVLRPAVRMTANIGYATFNAASYALHHMVNAMQSLRRPANYQLLPGNINMHPEGELELAPDNNDVVLNIAQAPDEEEKAEAILESNNAIIANIKNLVVQNAWSLLSEDEIETYKLKSGISEFESHVNTSACSIQFIPMKNPITIKFVTPEGELNGRSWEYTADADALIKFIERCNREKKPAYAPATRDLLASELVSFKSGFSDKQDEASIKAYAAGVKNWLSFWKAQAQQQAMLSVNDLSLSNVNLTLPAKMAS